MFPHVCLRYRPWNDWILQVGLREQCRARFLATLGHLLRMLRGPDRLRRSWRNINTSSESSNHIFQLGLLRDRLVSRTVPTVSDLLTLLFSVVFQWCVSYMISPDAGNMGVKAVYVWAGLLIPTTLLLWMYYPEVSRPSIFTLDPNLHVADLRSNLSRTRRTL